MFFCACEGYFDKLDDTAGLLRNLAGIIHRTMGGKNDMVDIWPLHNDKKPEKVKMWDDNELKELTENFKMLNI